MAIDDPTRPPDVPEAPAGATDAIPDTDLPDEGDRDVTDQHNTDSEQLPEEVDGEPLAAEAERLPDENDGTRPETNQQNDSDVPGDTPECESAAPVDESGEAEPNAADDGPQDIAPETTEDGTDGSQTARDTEIETEHARPDPTAESVDERPGAERAEVDASIMAGDVTRESTGGADHERPGAGPGSDGNWADKLGAAAENTLAGIGETTDYVVADAFGQTPQETPRDSSGPSNEDQPSTLPIGETAVRPETHVADTPLSTDGSHPPSSGERPYPSPDDPRPLPEARDADTHGEPDPSPVDPLDRETGTRTETGHKYEQPEKSQAAEIADAAAEFLDEGMQRHEHFKSITEPVATTTETVGRDDCPQDIAREEPDVGDEVGAMAFVVTTAVIGAAVTAHRAVRPAISKIFGELG